MSGSSRRTAEVVSVAALILAVAARLLARPHAPLWLDETFTGALISQPDLGHFVRALGADVQAPLYGIVMRGWQALFGLSDTALRTPSLLFGLAAPAVILLWRLGELSRTERLAWAALLALWIPGIGFAQDARCYSLVLLLATIQSLAFRDLLRAANLRRAALWVIACELTIAGHYDASYLAFAQGVIFLVLKRGAAVRCWPALLLLAPLAAFAAWQYPEARLYMQPGIVWYGRVAPQDLPAIAGYLLGWTVSGLGIVATVLVSPLLARNDDAPVPAADTTALGWAAGAAVLGAALVVAAGMIKPSLSLRYLAPFAPGVMLGLILAVRALCRLRVAKTLAFLQVFTMVVCLVWLARGAHHNDSVLEPESWEQASLDLMHAGAPRVVFLWDHPAARVMSRQYLADVGGFFLRRAGARTAVVAIAPVPGQDSNRALLDAAMPAGSAILWVYDNMVDGASVRTFPPRIPTLDPTWRCRNYAEGNPAIGVIACLRRPQP